MFDFTETIPDAKYMGYYFNSTLTYYILQRFFSLFAPTLKGAN